MRVIDLLNKIANGKGIPQRIKWGCHILEWQVYHYVAIDDYGKPDFFELTHGISRFMLNDEVEVIEEDKKIEIIKDLNADYYDNHKTYDCVQNEEIVLDILTLKHKINEIIDKANEGE